MQRFSQFSKLSLLEGLILESKLEFSKGLVDVLSIMSEDRIKDELLRAVSLGVDRDFSSNYLDITNDKDEYIEYIPTSKADRILGENKDKWKITDTGKLLKMDKNDKGEFVNADLFSRLSYVPTQGDIEYSPEVGDFCKIERETTNPRTGKVSVLISFLDSSQRGMPATGIQRVIRPAALSPLSDDYSRLWKEQRARFKVGKIAKSILTTLGISFTETEIANFSSKFKSAWLNYNDAFSRFDLVEGVKIAYWYKSDRYSEQRSTLGSSCMKEKEPYFFEIYSKNPDVCKLLILYDQTGKMEGDKFVSNFIMGRALVWTLDDGRTFVDRIYYIDEKVCELFKDYIARMGWFRKNYQDSDSAFYLVDPHGNKESRLSRIKVKVKDPKTVNCSKYPYIDTLCYVDREEGLISNYRIYNDSSDVIICRSTSGYYENADDEE